MRTLLFSSIFLLMSSSLYAQGSGFDMLNISPTAYSLSRAEATVSVPEGAASIYMNPALLSLNNSSSIDLGYSFWVVDVANIFGGVNFKNDRQAIAFSFYSTGADDYEARTNPTPEPNGTFSVQHLSVAAAYSYNFDYFALGGTFQFLNEQNNTYRASGYAFNVGIASRFINEKIRTGASVSNIGEMQELLVDATTLPANFRAGISADLFEITAQKNDELPILISAYTDFVYPLTENENQDYVDYVASSPYFNLGLAVKLADVVEISGGYKTLDDVRPLSFGASFDADIIQFSYALVPFKGFGTVHSVGVQYKF